MDWRTVKLAVVLFVDDNGVHPRERWGMRLRCGLLELRNRSWYSRAVYPNRRPCPRSPG